MAERGSPSADGFFRELAERFVPLANEAVLLTRERADMLVDELAERGALPRREARELIDLLLGRWRGESATRRPGASTLDRLVRELGLMRREDVEELELRLAAIEHRLRLLERG